MEINSFINAIAEKLTALYPDFKVYDGEIEQSSYENVFFITVIGANQYPLLRGRYKRRYSFNIEFWAKEASNFNSFIWASVMLENFNAVEVCSNLFFTKDIEIKIISNIAHCLFDIVFYVKEDYSGDASIGAKFENLDWNGGLKNGEHKNTGG